MTEHHRLSALAWMQNCPFEDRYQYTYLLSVAVAKTIIFEVGEAAPVDCRDLRVEFRRAAKCWSAREEQHPGSTLNGRRTI